MALYCRASQTFHFISFCFFNVSCLDELFFPQRVSSMIIAGKKGNKIRFSMQMRNFSRNMPNDANDKMCVAAFKYMHENRIVSLLVFLGRTVITIYVQWPN